MLCQQGRPIERLRAVGNIRLLSRLGFMHAYGIVASTSDNLARQDSKSMVNNAIPLSLGLYHNS
jgi:hypothetical protein